MSTSTSTSTPRGDNPAAKVRAASIGNARPRTRTSYPDLSPGVKIPSRKFQFGRTWPKSADSYRWVLGPDPTDEQGGFV